MIQQFFANAETVMTLCSQTGAVQIEQEDAQVSLTAQDAVLAAFHILYYLAPDLLDEPVASIRPGEMMALGLPTGNLFLSLHPTETL